ncbi:MAG: DUF6263 family protein [Ferruginibacter sp.]
MKYLRPTLFIAVACLLVNLSVIAQKPSGKLTLAKGQQIQLENNLKTITTMDMMGTPMEMTADASMLHSIEVKDKKQSSFILSSTMTKLKSNISAMGQAQSFDSDKPEDLSNETGKMMKGVLNVPKEVELNSDGKIINSQQDSSSLTAGAGMMQALQGMMGGAMNDGSGAAEAFLVIPAGKKQGDNWSDSLVSDEMKIYRNYTLKEINGNKATVTIDGKQLTNKKVEQMGMEVNVTLDAKLTGETVVNVSSGIIEQKTFSMEGTGAAEMMGQSIPMTTKFTSAVTVKK